MSSTFSAESAASASDLNGPECEPSRSAKSTPIAAPSLPSTGQYVPVYDRALARSGRQSRGLAGTIRARRRQGRIEPGSATATTLTTAALIRHSDVICGGFPCQDISTAGKGAGITGERSGLWKEYARIIGEVRPRYVIVENVAALLVRGMGRVLGDLSEIGYDTEWYSIRASDVGAPHRRDRIWIVAYTAGVGREYASGYRYGEPCEERATRSAGIGGTGKHADVADADQPRLAFRELLAGLLREARSGNEGQDATLGDWWLVEPSMGELVDGVSGRLVRKSYPQFSHRVFTA